MLLHMKKERGGGNQSALVDKHLNIAMKQAEIPNLFQIKINFGTWPIGLDITFFTIR